VKRRSRCILDCITTSPLFPLAHRGKERLGAIAGDKKDLLKLTFSFSFSLKAALMDLLPWLSRELGVAYMLPSLFWNLDGGTLEAS
jgi:hypothetical protein